MNAAEFHDTFFKTRILQFVEAAVQLEKATIMGGHIDSDEERFSQEPSTIQGHF